MLILFHFTGASGPHGDKCSWAAPAPPWLWEEVGVPGEKLHGHMENMQTPLCVVQYCSCYCEAAVLTTVRSQTLLSISKFLLLIASRVTIVASLTSCWTSRFLPPPLSKSTAPLSIVYNLVFPLPVVKKFIMLPLFCHEPIKAGFLSFLHFCGLHLSPLYTTTQYYFL